MSTQMSTNMSSNGEGLCNGPTENSVDKKEVKVDFNDVNADRKVNNVDIKEEVPDDDEISNESSLEQNKEIKNEDVKDELLDPKSETNGNFHFKKEEVKNEDEDDSSLDNDDDDEEDEEEFSDSDDDDEVRDDTIV